jgi:hypothetical protein
MTKAKQKWLAAFRRWGRAMARYWAACKELWCESTPLWFPLLSVILAIVAGLALDQTEGILQAMIDPPVATKTQKAIAIAQQFHVWCFLAGLCLWSFVNYQATRLLHEFDYHSAAYAGRLSQHEGWIGWIFKRLERLSPMLAGLGPPVAVGLAFYVLGRRYPTESESWFGTKLLLFTPCLVIFLLATLRPWRASPRLRKGQHRKLNDVLSKAEIGVICLFLFLIGLLIAVTAFAPQIWSLIGPGATLCVAAAAFVLVGSLFVFWGSRCRIPLIFITLIGCIIISPWNDNHGIRIRRGSEFARPDEALGIRDAMTAWKRRLPLDEPNAKPGQKTPLFIICAEGGGVRAAYWAARLFAYLEDTTRKYPDLYVPFSSRVVVISGVSGGSLAAATFGALLDRNPVTDGHKAEPDWFYEHVANFLGRDHLSAPLASAAFIDTTQRFLPFSLFNQRDRAAGLERAWEHAWGESLQSIEKDPTGFCKFDDEFRTLWRNRGDPYEDPIKDRKRWMPSLFFNGTSVELGGRIVVSDCLIPSGDYPGAQDALNLLKLRRLGKDDKDTILEPGLFRLSTAVNFSTRFPGISPSGEIPPRDGQPPQRVVDGGYYDNSGARTAWDNLVPIYYQLLGDMDPTKESSKIIPWVIIVRAGPPIKRSTPSLPVKPKGFAQRLCATPQHFMVDLLAPARAFLNAWVSRSADAAEALKDGTCLISRRLAGTADKENSAEEKKTGMPSLERVDYSPPRDAHDPFVIDLNLELDERNTDSTESEQRKKRLLPLGWMLPGSAMGIMEAEVKRLAPTVKLLDEGKQTHDDAWFRRLQVTQLGRVLSLLHRERPGGVSQEAAIPTPTPTPTPGPIPTPTPPPSSTPTATQTPISIPTPAFSPPASPPPPPPIPNHSPTPIPSPIVSARPNAPICVPRRRVDLQPVR